MNSRFDVWQRKVIDVPEGRFKTVSYNMASIDAGSCIKPGLDSTCRCFLMPGFLDNISPLSTSGGFNANIYIQIIFDKNRIFLPVVILIALETGMYLFPKPQN